MWSDQEKISAVTANNFQVLVTMKKKLPSFLSPVPLKRSSEDLNCCKTRKRTKTSHALNTVYVIVTVTALFFRVDSKFLSTKRNHSKLCKMGFKMQSFIRIFNKVVVIKHCFQRVIG